MKFGGVCYETLEQASDALQAGYPKIDAVGYTTFASVVPAGPDSVTASVFSYNFGTDVLSEFPAVIGFPACDAGMGQFAGADVGVLVAIFVCWALGFSGGLRVQ